MLKRFSQGAKTMGGSALTGARGLGTSMGAAGKATAASVGRGFDTVTSSRPVVSTAVALKKQTFDLKMKTGTLISILFLLVFYISVSALAINVINKCSGAKDSKKLQNMKGYFSHTLAMAIGVVVTLFTIQLFTAELSAFYVIFSLMGAVGSYMLINVINECDPSDKKSKVTYAGISAAINTLMLLVCGFMLFRGKKTIQKSLQGPATFNGIGPEYLG
jgi:hypothetical protein